MKRVLFLFITLLTVLEFCACGESEDVISSPNNTSILTGVTNDKLDEELSKPEIPTPEEIEPEESIEVSSEPEDKSFTIDMTFAGDCILASYLNQPGGDTFDDYAETHKPEYFLEKVRPIFEADDFTVVNLENVFSDKEDLEPIPKDSERAFWFKAKNENLKILTSSGVEGVTLANNHTGDYGRTGYYDTVDAVTNAGLEYGDFEVIMYFEKNGFKIAVVCVGLWGEYGTDEIIGYLNTASEKSDYQIVYFHGGAEYLHQPEDWKMRSARRLVDNGADLVIGSHPHVLQPREVYNGVEIVYSLGNFCYGGNRHPENRTILYQMKLTINEELEIETSESNIIPCYVFTGEQNNFQPAPITDEEHIKQILDFMDGKTDSPKP